mgnify:CR=1 FL=1
MNTKKGRPKGYSPYAELTLEELSDWVGKKNKIPVSRKWVEFIMGKEAENVVDISADNQYGEETTEKEPQPKIAYTITEF